MLFMAIASSRGLGGILVTAINARMSVWKSLVLGLTSGVQGQLNRKTGSSKLTGEIFRKDRVLFTRNALRRFGKDGELA